MLLFSKITVLFVLIMIGVSNNQLIDSSIEEKNELNNSDLILKKKEMFERSFEKASHDPYYEPREEIRSGYNEIKEGLNKVYNGAKEAAADKYKETKDNFKNKVVDNTKETLSSIKYKSKEKLDEVKHKINDLKEVAKEKIENVSHKYEDIRDEFKEKSINISNSIKEKLKDKQFNFFTSELFLVSIILFISSCFLWYSRKKEFKINKIKSYNLNYNNLNLD